MVLRSKSHQLPNGAAGFLLLELLLALAIGLLLLGQIAQGTLLETGQARRLGRLFRERLVAQRAIQLIRLEVQEALRVSKSLPRTGHDDCGLSDREVLLHLQTTAGKITYSIDKAPSSIWRGHVLMRCGPSYSLYGRLNSTDQESRVVLDALLPHGVTVTRPGSERYIAIELQRQFVEPGRSVQRFTAKASMPAPGLDEGE